VFQVAFAEDGIWAATDSGLARLQSDLQVVEVLRAADNGMASDWTGSVFAASDGALWVATDSGVSRRTPAGEWEHFAIGNPFTNSFYRAFAFVEDSSGAIWIATYGDGAYQYTNGTWQQFSLDVGLPSPDINNPGWSSMVQHHVRCFSL
jgi:ligand-binding sensor domain-containing protein